MSFLEILQSQFSSPPPHREFCLRFGSWSYATVATPTHRPLQLTPPWLPTRSSSSTAGAPRYISAPLLRPGAAVGPRGGERGGACAQLRAHRTVPSAQPERCCPCLEVPKRWGGQAADKRRPPVRVCPGHLTTSRLPISPWRTTLLSRCGCAPPRRLLPSGLLPHVAPAGMWL